MQEQTEDMEMLNCLSLDSFKPLGFWGGDGASFFLSQYGFLPWVYLMPFFKNKMPKLKTWV